MKKKTSKTSKPSKTKPRTVYLSNGDSPEEVKLIKESVSICGFVWLVEFHDGHREWFYRNVYNTYAEALEEVFNYKLVDIKSRMRDMETNLFNQWIYCGISSFVFTASILTIIFVLWG